MLTIYNLIPDPEVLLNLQPEELAGSILKYLHSFPPSKSNYLNFKYLTSEHMLKEYPTEHHHEITRALMEAWAWLKNEGLIVSIPGSNLDRVSITKKGEHVKTTDALNAYCKANLLPKQLLHSSIAENVWSHFSRGKYGTAVFEAFKAVEIAVRDAINGTGEDHGTYQLMRNVFHPETGKLSDANQEPDEKQATSDLFAGAMGLFRNPHAHRNIDVTAAEAVKIIMLASYLLEIVDSRTPTSNAL